MLFANFKTILKKYIKKVVITKDLEKSKLNKRKKELQPVSNELDVS